MAQMVNRDCETFGKYRIIILYKSGESSMQLFDSFASLRPRDSVTSAMTQLYIGYRSKPGSSTSCVSRFIWHLLARPRHTSPACYTAIGHSSVRSVSSDNSSDKTEVRWARL